MTPIPAFACLAVVSAMVLLPAAMAGQVDAALREEIRGLRTVRLEVRQSYVFQAYEDPTSRKEFLPLVPLAAEIVRLAGWRTTSASGADLTLRIDVTGTAQSAEYTGTLSGRHYSGASLSGSIALERGERTLLEEAIDANVSPPYSITSSYHAPESAPFSELLPDYCSAIWLTIGRALGPDPMLGAIARGSDQVRRGAIGALLAVCDETTGRAFRAMLLEKDAALRRLGALGLGVVGDASDVPALLDALRVADDLPPAANDSDVSAWLEISVAQEQPDFRRESALEQAREHEATPRMALLWALLQLGSADLAKRLAAEAARGPPAFRANLLLLLGQSADPAASGPIHAAIEDPEPLVRAASLAAMQDGVDERLAEPLLRLGADEVDYVRQSALARLETLSSAAWGRFRASRGGPPATSDTELVAAGFSHTDPLVRLEALRRAAEGERGPHRDRLSRMVREDAWASLRGAAVEALKDDSATESVTALAAALRDPVPFVRGRALAALAGESTEWEQASPAPLPDSVVEPALAMARAGRAGEADRAVAVLGRAGGLLATEAMQQLALGPAPEEVRRRAVAILVRTRPSTSAPVLVQLAANSSGTEMDAEVAAGLGELAHPATVDPLIAMLKSANRPSRRVAARALGLMKMPRAVGPLIAALQIAQGAGPERDDELAGVVRTSLEELTGRWFEGAEEWRAWWRENATQLTARK